MCKKSNNKMIEDIENQNYENIYDGMYEALKNNDLNGYKILFEKYMNNRKLINEFMYDEYVIGSDHHFTLYPFCICHIGEDAKHLMKPCHRHCSFISCKCENGKYYLALEQAYNELDHRLYIHPYEDNRPTFYNSGHSRMKNLKEYCENEENNFPKSLIINYLEDMYYKEKRYPLLLYWIDMHCGNMNELCIYCIDTSLEYNKVACHMMMD
jgi:hypothetical protein